MASSDGGRSAGSQLAAPSTATFGENSGASAADSDSSLIAPAAPAVGGPQMNGAHKQLEAEAGDQSLQGTVAGVEESIVLENPPAAKVPRSPASVRSPTPPPQSSSQEYARFRKASPALSTRLALGDLQPVRRPRSSSLRAPRGAHSGVLAHGPPGYEHPGVTTAATATGERGGGSLSARPVRDRQLGVKPTQEERRRGKFRVLGH